MLPQLRSRLPGEIDNDRVEPTLRDALVRQQMNKPTGRSIRREAKEGEGRRDRAANRSTGSRNAGPGIAEKGVLAHSPQNLVRIGQESAGRRREDRRRLSHGRAPD
jgi:hypothetical protein